MPIITELLRKNSFAPLPLLLTPPYLQLQSPMEPITCCRQSHFSVLSIPLDTQSQNIFAFTWTDPETLVSTQLTWTVLPLFGQALASDLLSLSLPKSTVHPYKLAKITLLLV